MHFIFLFLEIYNLAKSYYYESTRIPRSESTSITFLVFYRILATEPICPKLR